MASSRKLLTVREVASLLRVSTSFVYHGGLGVAPYRIGRCVRYDEDEVMAWAERRRSRVEGSIIRIGIPSTRSRIHSAVPWSPEEVAEWKRQQRQRDKELHEKIEARERRRGGGHGNI